MQTIGLISLGCARNLVDSEVMLGSLKRAGYHLSHDPSQCDVIIVNTCGFIEDSKKESIDTILEMASLKKKGRLKKLVMAGCLSQRYSKELSGELSEVDLFVGTGEFPNIVKLLQDHPPPTPSPRGRGKGGGENRVHVGAPRALADETLPRILATPKHHAYLKLAEGCQHSCSFCVIPKLRGPLRSRSIDSLVIETQNLLDQGVKEFNLIAQDSTGFGRDRKDNTTLLKLMERLTKLKGEKWFRLFYAYPHGFPMEVVDLMRNESDICKYLDLPIQHINDKILQSMRRKGTSDDIRKLVVTLRDKIPEITLRTTCIVGYPGETEKEFQELVDFVSQGHFNHVGIFVYSEEEGTTASKLKDDVPSKVKRARKKQLMEIQQKISHKHNESWVGREIKVLIDGPSPESEMILTARHQGQAPDVDGIVYINECDLSAGQFANVQITEAHAYDLVANNIV